MQRSILDGCSHINQVDVLTRIDKVLEVICSYVFHSFQNPFKLKCENGELGLRL